MRSALRLSSFKGASVDSAELPSAFASLSPHAESDFHREQAWAAVLSWIVLSSLPWQGDRAASSALFDKLHLRSALAETFQSLGSDNETSWRAAAKIRLLVLHGGTPSPAELQSHEFWTDPDLRWLAGVGEYSGQTYVNKEQFEELIAWLQLPALIEIAQLPSPREGLRDVELVVKDIDQSAQKAGYNLQSYLSSRNKTADEKPAMTNAKATGPAPKPPHPQK
jgi:hypothetical protein